MKMLLTAELQHWTLKDCQRLYWRTNTTQVYACMRAFLECPARMWKTSKAPVFLKFEIEVRTMLYRWYIQTNKLLRTFQAIRFISTVLFRLLSVSVRAHVCELTIHSKSLTSLPPIIEIPSELLNQLRNVRNNKHKINSVQTLVFIFLLLWDQ